MIIIRLWLREGVGLARPRSVGNAFCKRLPGRALSSHPPVRWTQGRNARDETVSSAMTTTVRYSAGTLWYTGRLARASFVAWTDSPQGEAVLKQAAAAVRFSLFGRTRTARRRMWTQLAAASRSETVATSLQLEVDRFLAHLDTLAHARGLPCETIELYRLVVVPRLLLNAEVCRRVDRALARQAEFASIGGGLPLRDWFLLTLVDAAAAAVVGARPSVKRPLSAGDGWITVGVNQSFEWRVPFRGPAWPGHYYVLERTPSAMTRGFRKSVTDRIARLEASLPSLSRLGRDEILRQAGSSLTQLVAADIPLIARERA